MNDVVAPTVSSPSRRSVLAPARASRLQVAGRAVAWAWFFIRMYAAITLDYWSGRDTPERRLARARVAIHRMGASAIPVARQLALRRDLLPMFAPMLAAVDDSQLPFPFEQAKARIAAAARRPVGEVFSSIDPTPLTSTAMACEYRGVLLGGEAVRVKVRRPGIRRRFAADLAALALLIRAMERATLIRPGLLDHLEAEIGALVVAESDFRNQARFQTLFRRKLKKDGLTWVTAPEAHAGLLADDVLVSTMVTGVRLSDLLGASEKAFLSLEVTPRRLGRRLLEVGWWALFENPFFPTEPDSNDIIVQQGGALVLVEFGNVMTPSGRGKRLIREAYRRLATGDVTAATDLVVQSLTPLPFIDVFAFTKQLEARLWQQYLAMIDPDAAADERSFGGVLRAILETAGEASVPVHQDIAGMLRSSAVFDELALQVDPKLRPLREFRTYLARTQRRAARKVQRTMRRTTAKQVRTRLLTTMDRAARVADRATFWFESLVQTLPVSNLSMASKVSYGLSQILSLGVQSAALLVLLATGYTGWQWRTGTPIVLADVFGALAVHPGVWLVMLIPLIMTLRRLQFRLRDKDPDP